MDRYRGSQLRILRSCHFAYSEQYIKGIEGTPSPALARGSAVHAAIAEAAKSIVETGMLNVHEVAYRAVRGGGAEYGEALELLTRFQEALGTEFDIDAGKVLGIEDTMEMELQLPDGSVVIFFGTPDLSERTGKHAARITDYKTNFQTDTEEEFAADPQLDRYALLLNARYPALKEFELTKRFVRYRNNFKTRVITEEDFSRIREQLITEIMIEREIRQAGVFKATPGTWCGLCGFHATCPRIRQYRELGMDDVSIEDDDRARELAGDVVALEAFAARMKNHLKVYLGRGHKTGFVPLSGGAYGYGEVQEREVPAPKLIEVLRAQSLDPTYDLFTTNTKALDKLLKRAPENVVQAVEAITLRRTTPRCQFRRYGDTNPEPTIAGAVQEDLL